ncbi:WD repeat-containing protein 55 [Babesia microti strain RI]|uniref:WD repeat-containing protein 55 n=1 Tax=Babesia microti (strain RI) TaxID=1133968 RepID=A0A1N6LW89_BABMR|nr:WD repeat-containing protein 55 [Babesia microti strain RI]SIO73142.1 WD repeat-containing protein 55 [Babesia microti strain RI]|eukprot:XP_021337254.1 WD repeat-containing protein 55 [Babesia microti strain RI]
MMCIELVKEGKIVVCGGQTGKVYLFSSKNWNSTPNRITGNNESINKMVKLTETSVCASCEDGSIKVFSVYPNKIAGSLSFNNEKFSTENICMSHDKKVLAFIMNFNNVNFANARDAFDLAEGKKIRNGDSDFFSDL